MNASRPLPPTQLPFGNLHAYYQEPGQPQPYCNPYSLRKYSYRDGLGGSHHRSPYTEPAYRNDEGYLGTDSSSASASTRPNYHLPSISAGFGLHHNQFQLHSSTENFFDMKNKRALVKRFDTKGPGPHLNASSTSSTSDTFLRLSGDIPVPPLSVPTSLPLHFKRWNFLDTQTPSSALSEPAIESRSGISLAASSRRNNSDNALPHNHEAHEMEMKENNPAKRLRIEDPMRAHYDGTRAKRRTSMNPDNAVSLAVTLPSDSLHRHDESRRGSPTRQLSVIHQQSAFSVSSCSTASHSSDSHLHTRSIASIGLSYGQISPGEPSPGAIPSGRNDAICISPHDALMSLNASPRGSIPRVTYQRTTSNDGPPASPRKPTEASKPDEHKILGEFLCDCCPKKPKKFTSAAELASHEAGKPYACSFCGNRFKNKNEAERHQNSVHVRDKSWSCSALNDYDQAFHDSTNRPGEADSCGYCGEEFLKNGRGSGDPASHRGTEQDWDERVYHLREVHKFRECNSSKKFFRADHFRQHLKHSHADTSGTWTNALENACILIEDSAAR
ncbi:hypothetical protein CABS02_14331 [Colletotrichum abscissum]|uniref:C2H2-type domain-containing protein n=1 Tax=Colletotrichum abscissum TaxID=1671311 RepID=A0A9P9X177_9PEZI|nr:hypothetical protein CABS02_14331 [Colletotrichum abscissum]